MNYLISISQITAQIHRGKAFKMDTGVNMGTPTKVTIRNA